MIDTEYFFEKIKDVKLSDILSIGRMLVGKICAVFSNKYKGTWIICEEPKEARDNGYSFFEYMTHHHPEVDCYYAIDRKSVDFPKVSSIGKTIEYGSIQHWWAYFNCRYNISSQKGGKPNAAVCSFFELNNLFHTCNVFLQHGVIINDLKWLYAAHSKIDYFITSTIPEYNFLKESFGYKDNVIQLTGLPRFDYYHNIDVKKNRVLIMPTWRYWLKLNSKKTGEVETDIKNSDYLKKWMEIINSAELADLAEKYDLEVIFYPHRNMQGYLDNFKVKNERIIVASWKEYDIQELLKSSAMMITDYSSVFFDMIYMKKPIVFYQFDENEYRKYQYEKGYFDYHDNCFGNCFDNYIDVLDEVENYANCRFQVTGAYLKEHKKIFPYYDDYNSKRIFDVLKEG